MASLQARHGRNCALGKSWTKGDPEATTGCTCRVDSRGVPHPTYHVVVHLGAGGRTSVGRAYGEAVKRLTGMQAGQNKGDDQTLRNMPFDKWVDEWKSGLTRPGASTLRSYESTISYAKEAFESKAVRKITVGDIETMLDNLDVSDSTKAKHLRVLSSMFKKAVRRGYASSNPVDMLDASERPQATKKEAPYFTNDELPLLIGAVEESNDKALVTLALLTGMRLGELIALRWSNVDVTNKTIHVIEAHKDGLGVGAPKSARSKRDVELTKQAVKVLGSVLRAQGVQDDEKALVFPPSIPTCDGYRRGDSIPRYVLYPAMTKAGIVRNGRHLTPSIATERTFHSLRHTYARIALENGADPNWLSRQMGHSTTAVTLNVYGHWSKAAAKVEAAKLEGAFSL